MNGSDLQPQKKFNVGVLLPDEKLAFELLAWDIHNLSWCEKNNRPDYMQHYKKENIPLINDMIQNRNMDKSEFFEKYQKRFERELYNPDLYPEKISQINEAISKLQASYDRIEQLHKSWGFEILDKYYININLWGCGGSYNYDKKGNGLIKIGGDSQQDRLASIIGHELIHLGIEKLIINPKNEKNPPVQQEEKERIVDNLCIYAMGGILPLERRWKDGTKSPYQEVSAKCAYMDKVVGEQPTNNLVVAVQKFLKDRQMSLGKEFTYASR